MTLQPWQGSLRRHYNPSPLIDSAGGRGLAFYRFVAIGYAALLIGVHREHVILWWPILLYGLLILTWSIVAPLLPRPTRTAIAVELALASAGIMLTSVVYAPAEVAAGISTVPGVWSASPVIAAALLAGIRGGFIGASIVSAANLLQVAEASQLTWHNIFLLYVVGVLVGLSVQLARESQVRLEQALVASERLAERERIGRQVHDGVLQTLAMIHRRGRQLGGEGESLADLAADQERSLRSMINRIDPVPPPSGALASPSECVDLTALLAQHRSARTEVVLPPGALRLPAATAREVEAAVLAALDNVERHAGDGARAWVLVDADDKQIEVVVRDNGIGMDPDRLVEAARAGRLGASSSIRGRMLDLGGDAGWRTPAGGGTTVTLSLPATHVAGSRP